MYDSDSDFDHICGSMHFNLHEVLHFIRTFFFKKKLPHLSMRYRYQSPLTERMLLPPNYTVTFKKFVSAFFITPTRGYSVAFQSLALKADKEL